MTAKTPNNQARDAKAGKPQAGKRNDELEAAALDKVTGGMASKIVKSADPCEGGR